LPAECRGDHNVPDLPAVRLLGRLRSDPKQPGLLAAVLGAKDSMTGGRSPAGK
jgi:hypothetical protein